jgi:methylmalonyl-CoA mutase
MNPTDTQSEPQPEQAIYQQVHKIRMVTAASLFDGHDAAINIMRRILQASGAEVIHLGHNCSVQQIVDAAIQEDAQGIAISSYQGGHMEYFKYMYDMLQERGCGHIRIVGGGGGTIIPEEKKELETYGITRIYHPDDGRALGLQGMINDILRECDFSPIEQGVPGELAAGDWNALSRYISVAELIADGADDAELAQRLDAARARKDTSIPVIGFTGTGGAGKSSFTDEMVRRFTEDFPDSRVAVLSVDPTRKRTGGALLGDRIRMNSLLNGRVFMRSLATRGSGNEISAALDEAIDLCRASGFDLIIAETSGIGQADSSIVDLANVSVYVMTPEYGAQTQLEKIEMIDLADIVVVNKFDKPGGADALRDVQKAYQRAHNRFDDSPESMPVYASMASQYNDFGCNTVYLELLERLRGLTGAALTGRYTDSLETGAPNLDYVIPPRRVRYLSEISDTVRSYKRWAQDQSELAAELWALARSIEHFGGPSVAFEQIDVGADATSPVKELARAFNTLYGRLDPASVSALASWPAVVARYTSDTNSYSVRGREITVDNYSESLSHQSIPKVSLPRYSDWGNQLAWILMENVPGEFPYTAGVFPFKRQGEDPTRMFAGEGGPWRTNKRFHYLSRHSDAKRLSTAFDSVTLYGEDPDRRPDIWGKVGNSGVSIATVEDMEALYAGFDLTSSSTSVSMTINGPAPTILAFFFNTAIRQSLRKHLVAAGKIALSEADCLQPDAGGYSFEDLRAMVSDEEYPTLVNDTVSRVRGTVQADILKEDQAQNTCIFSTAFALKMMEATTSLRPARIRSRSWR